LPKVVERAVENRVERRRDAVGLRPRLDARRDHAKFLRRRFRDVGEQVADRRPAIDDGGSVTGKAEGRPE
jgi:hypothetical protein